MKSEEKIIIIISNGEERKDLLFTPLNIAQVAVAVDVDVKLIFTGNGGRLLRKDIAAKTTINPNGSPLLTTFSKIREMGVKFYLCSPVLEYFGWKKDDMIQDIDGFVGAMFLISESLEADVTYTF